MGNLELKNKNLNIPNRTEKKKKKNEIAHQKRIGQVSRDVKKLKRYRQDLQSKTNSRKRTIY